MLHLKSRLSMYFRILESLSLHKKSPTWHTPWIINIRWSLCQLKAVRWCPFYVYNSVFWYNLVYTILFIFRACNEVLTFNDEITLNNLHLGIHYFKINKLFYYIISYSSSTGINKNIATSLPLPIHLALPTKHLSLIVLLPSLSYSTLH